MRRLSDRQVQVAPEHYDFERYDDPERWMSYWHQLRAVLVGAAEDRARDRSRLGRLPQLPARRRRRRQDARYRRVARRRLRRRHHQARPDFAAGPHVRCGLRVPGPRAPAVRRVRDLPGRHRAARQPARVHLAALPRPARSAGRSGGATTSSRSATSSCCRGGTSRSPSTTGSSAIRSPRARSRS